jgi:hypothetical protein
VARGNGAKIARAVKMAKDRLRKLYSFANKGAARKKKMCGMCLWGAFEREERGRARGMERGRERGREGERERGRKRERASERERARKREREREKD